MADDHVIAAGKTFPWHEVYTKDVQASIDFYTGALDWGTTSMPMGEMGDYHMLTANGQPVCGVFPLEAVGDPNVPPHWATYIGVDDIDARLAKCEALGATKLMGPMEVATVGRMALICDPQGAHVWLYEPAPQG
ncbi:MAG: VOC family protein [Fimbriimonadaceae bacterium]